MTRPNKEEETMALVDDADALVGPVRTALNQSDSSIHDPAEAKKLGFRGAAVGGNNHLDLFALGMAWALFDSAHQGFHDKLADTYVVRSTPA